MLSSFLRRGCDVDALDALLQLHCWSLLLAREDATQALHVPDVCSSLIWLLRIFTSRQRSTTSSRSSVTRSMRRAHSSERVAPRAQGVPGCGWGVLAMFCGVEMCTVSSFCRTLTFQWCGILTHDLPCTMKTRWDSSSSASRGPRPPASFQESQRRIVPRWGCCAPLNLSPCEDEATRLSLSHSLPTRSPLFIRSSPACQP